MHNVTVFEELLSQNTDFPVCISALPLLYSLFRLSHGAILDMLILDMFISVHVYSSRFVSENTVSLFFKYKLEVGNV